MVVQVLNVAEVIVFVWGILQARITKNWKRWLAAILIFLGGEIFYLLCPNEDVGYLLGQLVGHMISSVILLEESIGKAIAQYWFGLLYISVIYLPLEIVSYIWEQGGKTSFQYRDETISILAILLMILIAVQIKKRKQWVKWIRTIRFLILHWARFADFVRMV